MSSIKDVPMLTADEQEIKVNSVLFTTEWSSGYDWSKEGKAVIESYRVISVNNSARHFRTRCSKGCEQEHQVSKGCSRTRLWGSIENARKELIELINKDADKALKKADEINKTAGHILTQRKLAAKMLPTKTPKEVKV